MSKLDDIFEKSIWADICKNCGGGGTNPNVDEPADCPKCNGTGLVNWQTKLAKQQIKELMLELIEQSATNHQVYDKGEVLGESKTVGYYELRQKVAEL